MPVAPVNEQPFLPDQSVSDLHHSLVPVLGNHAYTINQLIQGNQPISEKGEINGYAGLDSNAKVPLAQLPAQFANVKNVLDFIEPGDANDRPAIVRAIAAAVAEGGGLVHLPGPRVYEIDAEILVDTSLVRIYGDGFGITVVKGIGNASPFTAFRFDGPGFGASLGPLTTNFLLGTRVAALTSVAGLAAGDLLRINSIVTVPPGQSAVCNLISEITSIASLNVTLEAPAPIDFLTAETPTVNEWTPIADVGLSDMTIDMGAATGTTRRGVWIEDVRDGIFENLQILNCSEAGLQTWRGYENTYDNIKTRQCGSGNESDIQFREETLASFGVIHSTNAAGFGPQFIACTYSVSDGVIDFGAAGRGFKSAGCLSCSFDKITSGNSGSTGIAITLRTQRCLFTNLTSIGNVAGSGNDDGLWFSGQSNIGNRVHGLVTYNNTDFDIAFFATDSDNLVSGVLSPGGPIKLFNNGGNTNAVLSNNSSNGFYGLMTQDDGANGEPISGLMKHSVSPAVSDFLGRYQWRGRSLAGAERIYAELAGAIADPTDAAELGSLAINIRELGVLVNHAVFQTPGTGQVGMLIRCNDSGVITLKQVKEGPADGTVAGHKILMVEN